MSGAPNRILSFATCTRCHREKPSNESMEKWARLNVGMTTTGLQVWCVRHRMEVFHYTSEVLLELVLNPPPCHCCPGGRHLRLVPNPPNTEG